MFKVNSIFFEEQEILLRVGYGGVHKDISFDGEDFVRGKILDKTIHKEIKEKLLSLNFNDIKKFLRRNNLMRMEMILIELELISLILRITKEENTYEPILLLRTSSQRWNKKYSIINFRQFFLEENKLERTGRIMAVDSIPIYVDENQIRNIKELTNQYFEIIENTIKKLEEHYSTENKIYYKIDKKIRTGIKQYITYFNDYVEKTKGITINFETENYDEGLILKVAKNQNIDRIDDYFDEYINFLKYENIDEIEPKYEIEKNEITKTRETMILRGELHALKYKYDTLNLELTYAKRENDRYQKDYEYLLHKMFEENNRLPFNEKLALPISIVVNNNNNNENTGQNNQMVMNLPNYINDIKELIASAKSNEVESELNEINKIAEELNNINNVQDLKGKKSSLEKFKKLVDEIENENSLLNKTIKAGKRGKDLLDKMKPYLPSILNTVINLIGKVEF